MCGWVGGVRYLGRSPKKMFFTLSLKKHLKQLSFYHFDFFSFPSSYCKKRRQFVDFQPDDIVHSG